MKLLSFNIQYGFGADGRYDLSRAARVIAKADIAALQEVERHWSRSHFDDQPALLQAAVPDRYTAFAPFLDLDASTREGPRIVNRRRQFGPMILSRWPILWTRSHLLPMARMIDPLNTQTGALEACIDTPSGPLRVISVHLAHVGTAERLAQIEVLLALIEATPQAGPPWSGTDDEPDRNWTEGLPPPPCPEQLVVMGDLNCEPGSAELRRLTGETPYHPGARYARGLMDAVAATGSQLHTHEKRIAGELRLRQLDHILVSPDLVPHAQRSWSDPSCPASDHFPLWLDLAPWAAPT